MSLLRNGPHAVSVTPITLAPGTLGTSTPVRGTPVRVGRVAVQPMAAEEREALGVQARTVYKVIGAGCWPGGHRSQVEVLTGPACGIYDQQGEALHYSMSPRTAHYEVVIAARTTEVK